MKLDKKGIDFIIEVEGLELKPYKDTAGVWTIGIGNTFYENGVKVRPTDKPITKERAVSLFSLISKHFEADVTSLVKTTITQNQFNALFSFAYNVGSDIDIDLIAEGLGDSTLLKKVNINPNDPTIANEIKKWNKSGGKVTQGLINRRQKEINLYFS